MKETLETEKLILKKWNDSPEDAKALFNFAKNKKVGHMAGWKPHEDELESLKIIREIFLVEICYKIIKKSDGSVIGNVGLQDDSIRNNIKSKELGYALAEHEWGKGHMVEACQAVIEEAFETLELEIMAIQTDVANIQSRRVIEKLGFSFEGITRMKDKVYDGGVRDVRNYSMTREEWKKKG